ncbi:CrcB family protein [Paenisporosarcina sp. TG20]|uniref:fluoride efflux transporter FluC n=1 Tax=Paenisporosarcina sp. TG20 TaxID=1211706 RepID=UPI0002FF9A31|nr:CrcB family protein [Paenisporosarcina sp. TG20]
MKSFILVGIGGMVGALLRYCVMVTSPDLVFLWVVNGLGSFVLGWLTGRSVVTGKATSVLWTTGVLGSFTTFSAFSAEWFILLQQNILFAFGYGLGITLICFLTAAIGFKIGGLSK